MRRPKPLPGFDSVDADEDMAWTFFSKTDFERLLNDIENANSLCKNGISAALDYGNMWGNIPLLGMRANKMKLVKQFLQKIEDYDNEHYSYTTFPRIGLNKKLALTAMIWQNLCTIQLEAIPRNLFDRNPGLKGGLKIAKCKHFKSSDLDVRGNPMNGVRLVQFESDQKFRDALFIYPHLHRFGLGCGRIIIRGGNRVKEEDAKPGGKWTQGPPKAGTSNNKKPDTANISQSAAEDILNQSGDVPMDEAERRARKDGGPNSDGRRNRSRSRRGQKGGK